MYGGTGDSPTDSHGGATSSCTGTGSRYMVLLLGHNIYAIAVDFVNKVE